MDSKSTTLVIVLENKNWQEIVERTELVHDGGQFLKWLINRLSIPRDRWVHTYCYEGKASDIPTKAWERKTWIEPHLDALLDFMMFHKPCSVVGMGKLAAECLTKGSLFKRRVGAYWGVKPRYRQVGIDHAWITYMPDAALFDPRLFVDMTRIIGKAAREADIEIEINYQLPIFRNWHKYYKSV